MQRRDPRVFFPWEKRRGLRSLVGRGRVRQVLVLAAAASGFVLLHLRERDAADVRATRAEITTATDAVSAWRADHDRTCPGTVADLVSGGYLHRVPRDAWGHPLRVTCPGRRDPLGFDVSSDGPDGEPWGADRVE
ncbi:MAG: type II secretion system protein GspG [Polyangiaceae bacterium]